VTSDHGQSEKSRSAWPPGALTRRRAVILTSLLSVLALSVGGSFADRAQAPIRNPGHAHGSVPDIDSFDNIMGSGDAKVTIIEYASFTCPHCANFHRSTLPALKKRYVEPGMVRLVFRDFPLDELALRAGMMARCAVGERYFTLVDALFDTQQQWTRAEDPLRALAQLGRLAGLSEDDLSRCLRDESVAARILAIREDASRKYGISSTPSFLIGSQRISGNVHIDALAAVIDPLVAG
jgi:protein-disulfide isomerase